MKKSILPFAKGFESGMFKTDNAYQWKINVHTQTQQEMKYIYEILINNIMTTAK